MNPRRAGSTIAFGYLFFFTSIFCPAQDQQDKKEEPPHWKGDLSVGLSLTRGNTNSSNLSFTFSAGGPVGKKLTWDNSGLFLYGGANKKTNVESGQIDSHLDWQRTERFFFIVGLQLRHDRFKNFNYRFLLPGLGVGYKFVNRKAVSLVMDTGLGVIFNQFYDTGRESKYLAVKYGQAFVWKISETAEFNEKAEIDAGLGDLKRYYIHLEANLIAAVTKRWAAKLTLTDSYDSGPLAPGIKHNDLILIAGLSAKF